jgi:hypothetical protein
LRFVAGTLKVGEGRHDEHLVMHNVVSVDVFIADAEDQVGPLFDWYFTGRLVVLGRQPAVGDGY